jgi:hypothetical protein
LDRERVPAGLGGVRNAYKVLVRNLNGRTRIKKWQDNIKVCLQMSGVIWLRIGTGCCERGNDFGIP